MEYASLPCQREGDREAVEGFCVTDYEFAEKVC